MTELLTAAQMRAIEHAAISSGHVTGLELMERAGRGVIEAIFEEWPDLQKLSGRAVVLCGPGNNGGDGFVVARLLQDWGWEVQVFLYGDAAKLPPDARQNHDRWLTRGDVRPLTEKAFRQSHPEQGRAYADVYVDALFGTGLTRPVRGAAYDVLCHMSGRNGDNYVPYTVAIDSPSGLCMDSGRVLGADIRTDDFRGKAAAAALTIAFDSPKVGHFIAAGPQLCGKLVIKDIGLKDWRSTAGDETDLMRKGGRRRVLRPERIKLVVEKPLVEDPRFRSFVHRLGKAGITSHKYTHGHALVLTGPDGKTGAARLAARGALRIGAGLITLGAPQAAMPEVASQITALMLTSVEDAESLEAMIKDKRLNAVCLGPGLGIERARHLVPVALGAKRATVLDADALSAYKDDPETLFADLHEKCVLTPHHGEFARLFPDIADRLIGPKPPDRPDHAEYDVSLQAGHLDRMTMWRKDLEQQSGPAFSKVDATRAAAQRAGCVVLFKGPDTVIASPHGQCSVNSAHYERAAPWLATAGSGDVLAGFITGLMARGIAPMQAAEMSAWLHVETARSFGPGLIAEDLPEQLPQVFGQLGL